MKFPDEKTINIGFVGHPPDEIISQYQQSHPNAIFIDIDEPFSDIPITIPEKYLPNVYCAILRTIMANALTLKLDLIITSVGECKCDGMRYIATMLEELIDCPIIKTSNLSKVRQGNNICTSSLPLKEKMGLIVGGIIKKHKLTFNQVNPIAGFWGVPPYDFDILNLFPDETHIYGWSRCLENRTPADLDLEMFVDIDIPTVFYSQAFCQKSGLARYLAKKHNGLYLEVDDNITNSSMAKLEAFLEFRIGKRVIT